jgi:hypothetical protein
MPKMPASRFDQKVIAFLDDARLADDVPPQNTIHVFVSARTGDWVARVGPEHESVEATGGTWDQALMFLQLKLKRGGYQFDHNSVLDV